IQKSRTIMLLDFLQGGPGSFDMVSFLQALVVSLPAILLALTLHEAAHGYVALRCGDPTAKLMGRVTLNPLKHLDPKGFLAMLLIGVGWAKPVPVNPGNFKHPRRDDIMVSMAGIAMNLIQFLLGCALMYAMLALALGRVPTAAYRPDGRFTVLVGLDRYALTAHEAYTLAPMMNVYLIGPILGTFWGYVYEFLVNYAVINLSLAVFNLLPMPPLDGYHLLNDLILKRDLFAPRKVQLIGQALVLLLVFTGVFGKGLGFVVNGAFEGMGQMAYALSGRF
ncbi:MAG: site-2 protease family protein, partial [Clostridia bacterium]